MVPGSGAARLGFKEMCGMGPQSKMSQNLPAVPDPEDAAATAHYAEEAEWSSVRASEPEGAETAEAFPWRRYVSAVLRFKWLVLVCFVLGGVAALVVRQTVPVEYQTMATVSVEGQQNSNQGPLVPQGLFGQQDDSWTDLLKTFSVMEEVVRRERRYLGLAAPGDSVLFSGFEIDTRFRLGSYVLSPAGAGRYTLTSAEGTVIESGVVGDSIGRELGFLWQPSLRELAPSEPIAFTVSNPRSVASSLRDEVQANLNRRGNFMTLTLSGPDGERAAETLNAVLDRYVEVAADLKRAKLDELTGLLKEQMDRADTNLGNAEIALESFRVGTITLPSDPATPIAPGLVQTTGTVYSTFFSMKTEVEVLRQDRLRLQSILASMPDSGLNVEALEGVTAVNSSSQMKAALAELTNMRAELRTMRYRYTEDYGPVQDLQRQIEHLETVTIPTVGDLVLTELQHQEDALQSFVNEAGSELEEIPQRTTAEGRLSRTVTSAQVLAQNLRNRYEEASLAAASSIPDVRIVDRAAPPQSPVNDTRMRFMLIALFGGLGLGLGAAILLDQIDPKVRYPQEVTSEMGLIILGTVPQISSKNGKSRRTADQALEAFRELRLNVAYAHGAAGPHVMTVTSPGMGEGKSLVTANLAVAFAELGRRTLIIDGDTRRGDVHELVGRRRTPGLTDFLAGEVKGREIIQTTDYPTLHIIGSGSRLARAPELLGSPAMRELLAKMRARYDVILVDTPPLAAGGDAFILGALTGNMALVLRNGTSDKALTRAKLEPIGRLPIRILGAILNDVRPSLGSYSYYNSYASYLPDYAPYDEPRPQVSNGRPASKGAVVGAGAAEDGTAE